MSGLVNPVSEIETVEQVQKDRCTASDGLLTAMLKSPSSINSPLELILDSSKLASSLQNSCALESGGLYMAMRLTTLRPVLILKQVDSIVSSD